MDQKRLQVAQLPYAHFLNTKMTSTSKCTCIRKVNNPFQKRNLFLHFRKKNISPKKVTLESRGCFGKCFKPCPDSKVEETFPALHLGLSPCVGGLQCSTRNSGSPDPHLKSLPQSLFGTGFSHKHKTPYNLKTFMFSFMRKSSQLSKSLSCDYL